jgi:hypothetical protein
LQRLALFVHIRRESAVFFHKFRTIGIWLKFAAIASDALIMATNVLLYGTRGPVEHVGPACFGNRPFTILHECADKILAQRAVNRLVHRFAVPPLVFA